MYGAEDGEETRREEFVLKAGKPGDASRETVCRLSRDTFCDAIGYEGFQKNLLYNRD